MRFLVDRMNSFVIFCVGEKGSVVGEGDIPGVEHERACHFFLRYDGRKFSMGQSSFVVVVRSTVNPS